MNIEPPSLEIPAVKELSGLRQWVVWKPVDRGEPKPAKVPFNPNTRAPASPVDSKTWGSFGDASNTFIHHSQFEGVGFVLAHGDGIVAIDLDNCVNPDTRKIEKWAQDIILKVNSYTEISPSGTGLHIFAKGSIDTDGRRHGNIEIYSAKRYVTVTGKQWAEFPEELGDATSQIAAILKTFPKRETPDSQKVGTFDLNAQMPAEKFAALLGNNSQFKKTWEHSRKDLADSSNSSYDLALCSFALHAEWNDDECAALIIAHRQKYGDPQGKAQRQDYLRRTIARAHSNLAKGVGDKDATAYATGEDVRDAPARERLSEISNRLGAPVVAVIKRGKSNAMYYLRLDNNKEVRIGTALDLNTQRVTRAALIDATGIVSARMRPAMWDQTLQLMLSVIEEDDIGDAEGAVHIANLILEYAEQVIPVDWDDKEAGIIMGRRPFVKGGALWFHADALRDWLSRSNGYRFDKKDLILSLREVGCIGKPHTRRENGTPHCKYYWGMTHKKLIALAGRDTTAFEAAEKDEDEECPQRERR